MAVPTILVLFLKNFKISHNTWAKTCRSILAKIDDKILKALY